MSELDTNVDTEWALIIGLCAAPFAAFAIFESVSIRRRRKEQAIARRSKSGGIDAVGVKRTRR